MNHTQEIEKEVIKVTKCFLDEVEALKKENVQLKKQLVTVIQSIKELAHMQGQLSSSMDNSVKIILDNEMILSSRMDNMKYELLDPDHDYRFFRPHFEAQEETIRKIVEERKSLARFGDGEFSIMSHKERWKFQRADDILSRRLLEVLHSDIPELIVAIADNYGSLESYPDECANGIRCYMTEETRKAHCKFLDQERIYADAYFTRFYVMYRDNMTDASRIRLERLKSMWEHRHIITVEGALTRLGVGNNLFDNAASLRRIIAPATSSFDKYEECFVAALKYAEPDTLFLLAIGPSSGVLAYDLTLKGYQALDVGHIDLEYEWYRAGQGVRVSIPGRYNNEVEGGEQVAPLSADDPYFEQILVSFDNRDDSQEKNLK